MMNVFKNEPVLAYQIVCQNLSVTANLKLTRLVTLLTNVNLIILAMPVVSSIIYIRHVLQSTLPIIICIRLLLRSTLLMAFLYYVKNINVFKGELYETVLMT